MRLKAWAGIFAAGVLSLSLLTGCNSGKEETKKEEQTSKSETVNLEDQKPFRQKSR